MGKSVPTLVQVKVLTTVNVSFATLVCGGTSLRLVGEILGELLKRPLRLQGSKFVDMATVDSFSSENKPILSINENKYEAN